jgi:hypothetical protein
MPGEPPSFKRAKRATSLPSDVKQARRKAAAVAQPVADEPLPLARKLVALAREQQHAFEIGAREQFDWITLRRTEVTERLSRLVAASVLVSDADAAVIAGLRDELGEVDEGLITRLDAARRAASTRQRTFLKARKSIDSYLTLGPRHGFFDKRQ